MSGSLGRLAPEALCETPSRTQSDGSDAWRQQTRVPLIWLCAEERNVDRCAAR